jgi:anti-sigma factor RsiW
MSCSLQENSPDWKAYILGDLDQESRRQAEAHAAVCTACRDELATLRLTLDTLSTLREEEVPRRIAFVSDKVFEPRWWQSFLRPSFAAACVIAGAILVHAFVQPVVSSSEMQSRIDQSVTKAVAQAEQKHVRQMEQLLADYEIVVKQNSLMYARNMGLVRQ